MASIFEALKLEEGTNELGIVVKDGIIASHFHTNFVKDGFLNFSFNGTKYECDIDAVMANSVKAGSSASGMDTIRGKSYDKGFDKGGNDKGDDDKDKDKDSDDDGDDNDDEGDDEHYIVTKPYVIGASIRFCNLLV